LILLIIGGAVIWLFILQFHAFRQDLPMLKEKLIPAIAEFQNWLNRNVHITSEQQSEWWKNTAVKLTDNPGALLTGSFSKIASGLFMLFIIPVFAALFLYNRHDFILFPESLTGNKYNGKLHLLLQRTIDTYFHFIKGMIWVYIIVGILNSTGLLLLGVKHAILFGFLTAFMTIIPYIGIFVSALLPITVAWITKDSIWYPLGVIALFVFVQYLEANIIFPKVVGAQLNVSTWATLIAIIAGGILWGVSGMILFIPLTGILKMATDNIPEWEPLNILLRRNGKKK
jgi:predicted PurR-regulated permease PerM